MVIDYKAAGVDVEAGRDAVKKMRKHIARTENEHVLRGVSDFGGMMKWPMPAGDWVMVAGSDGVGTKLKIAFLLDRHDTIGIDCVAMCVNDVLCHGAQPLFFLDYLATGHLRPDQAAEIVKGVADGCVQSGCVLLGGETAEMPGMYLDDEYDLAGFSVGSVEQSKLIDGSAVQEGDVLIGLSSSGAHANGFSLLRRLFITDDCDFLEVRDDLDGQSIAEALLTPTKIYVKPVQKLLASVDVHGMAHITGGGFYENVPRMIPDGLCADIDTTSWTVPPILELAVHTAEINQESAFSTFNMGIGFVIALARDKADAAREILRQEGETAQIIGTVITAPDKIILH